MKEYNPQTIRIFSRGELFQYETRQEFDDNPRVRFFIGDIRDRERVYRAMEGVDIVCRPSAITGHERGH
ncbi:polysaccharide biosynthesis protein [Chloroflexota bacterium]